MSLLRPLSPHRLALFLAAIYLIVGLWIVKDFGFNWDDKLSRYNGDTNWEYLSTGNIQAIERSSEKYHGPAFEIFLSAIEKTACITDYAAIYQMRHRVVFIFYFISIVVFYLIVHSLWRHPWLPLIGTAMLVLSPRIFGESMYNSKDIATLSAIIICTYTMIVFCRRSSWPLLCLHSIACAFAVDIRFNCLFIIPITALLFLCERSSAVEAKPLKVLFKLVVYLLLTATFVIVFWPILYHHTVEHLRGLFNESKNYPWDGIVIYFGQHLRSGQLPPSYQVVWLLLTTPLLHTFLFLSALLSLLIMLIKKPILDTLYIYRYCYSFLLLFFFPITIMWVLHAHVYDGWRHIYFIYPYFILVSMHGVNYVLSSSGIIIRRVLIVLVTSVLGFNLLLIISMHPHQYVYFNPLIVKALPPMHTQFEIDYWGLSYMQAMEYVAAQQRTDKPLKILMSDDPCRLNYGFVKNRLKGKIEAVSTIDSADYYLNFNREPYQEPSYIARHEIRREGMTLMSIYQLK